MSRYAIDPAKFAAMSPTERREAQSALLALEELRQVNPLHFYHPHDRQVEFHRSRAFLKAFLGGNRAGKTTAGINDDLIQTLPLRALPEHLRPFKRWGLDGGQPFRCRIVITDLTKSLDGVILEKVREWCPPEFLVGGSVDTAWNDKLGKLSFVGGAFWQIMSNDQELRKFSGAALHRIHYDEEPLELIRRECSMRLTDFDGDELLTMTPLEGMSWVYTEIFEPWENGETELDDMIVVQVDMDDNPHLTEGAKTRRLRGLSRDEVRARKAGRFVHFAGLIYSGVFSPDVHVVPDEDVVPADATVFCGIDPGIRHMAAVVYCYFRRTAEIELDESGTQVVVESDELVVFDEIAIKDETVEAVAAEIHARNAHWGIRPRLYVIDPAARNREQQTGRSTAAAFARHGIPTLPGQNSITAGINCVRERLERPGAFKVWASCTTLIGQFRRYRWKSPPRTAEGTVQEKPIQKDDHLLDALRYVCMANPIAPREQPRENLTRQQKLLRDRMRNLRNPAVEGITGGAGMLA